MKIEIQRERVFFIFYIKTRPKCPIVAEDWFLTARKSDHGLLFVELLSQLKVLWTDSHERLMSLVTSLAPTLFSALQVTVTLLALSGANTLRLDLEYYFSQ